MQAAFLRAKRIELRQLLIKQTNRRQNQFDILRKRWYALEEWSLHAYTWWEEGLPQIRQTFPLKTKVMENYILRWSRQTSLSPESLCNNEAEIIPASGHHLCNTGQNTVNSVSAINCRSFASNANGCIPSELDLRPRLSITYRRRKKLCQTHIMNGTWWTYMIAKLLWLTCVHAAWTEHSI